MPRVAPVTMATLPLTSIRRLLLVGRVSPRESV